MPTEFMGTMARIRSERDGWRSKYEALKADKLCGVHLSKVLHDEMMAEAGEVFQASNDALQAKIKNLEVRLQAMTIDRDLFKAFRNETLANASFLKQYAGDAPSVDLDDLKIQGGWIDVEVRTKKIESPLYQIDDADGVLSEWRSLAETFPLGTRVRVDGVFIDAYDGYVTGHAFDSLLLSDACGEPQPWSPLSVVAVYRWNF